MLPLESFIAWIFSLAFIGGILYIPALLHEPTWVQRDIFLKSRWSSLNLSAFLIAISTSAFASYLYAGADIAYVSYATVVVGMITFCAVQMFETDFAVRLADRFPLRNTLITTLLLGLGLFYLLGYEHEDMLSYIVFICVGAAMYLMTNLGFGESDARAFTISTIAVIVITGMLNLQYYFIGFLVFVLFYVGIIAVRRRNLKDLIRKVSLPAVPLMLFPAIFVLLSFPVLI